MKKLKCIIISLLCAVTLFCAAAFAGCMPLDPYVVDIVRSERDDATVFTVKYSDGTENELTVPRDGTNGKDGEAGQDGKDGKDLTVDAVYEKYVQLYGEMSYADFLKEYLPQLYSENNLFVGETVYSSLKLYTEFVESVFMGYNNVTYTGSSVIWSMSTGDDGYTYAVTNYHVVFDKKAVSERNGGTQLARKITGYLFGSEGKPTPLDERDENNYTVYDYGALAIPFEYVGGSIVTDIAVVRAKTSDILAINENAKPVTLASGYRLGEKAVAIGNSESLGLSVTQGIISVIDDTIELAIDNTQGRKYRSLRIDTPIYEGNSGGGLFNAQGELIGITNAGHSSDQNINYAIPLEIVTGAVENILYYYNDGDESTTGGYRMVFGMRLQDTDSKYVYNPATGSGDTVCDVIVYSIDDDSAALRHSLKVGDKITAIEYGGVRYELSKSSDLFDLSLNMRPNKYVKIEYERDGKTHTSAGEYLSFKDFVQI